MLSSTAFEISYLGLELPISTPGHNHQKRSRRCRRGPRGRSSRCTSRDSRAFTSDCGGSGPPLRKPPLSLTPLLPPSCSPLFPVFASVPGKEDFLLSSPSVSVTTNTIINRCCSSPSDSELELATASPTVIASLTSTSSFFFVPSPPQASPPASVCRARMTPRATCPSSDPSPGKSWPSSRIGSQRRGWLPRRGRNGGRATLR